MCLGLPMRVVEAGECYALCERRGERRRLDMRLLGPQPPGTWVLAWLDSAREVLDAQRAAEIDAALDALEAVLRGEHADLDLDLAFADLAGREPQLPPHLRGGT
jgi:hydrogenase expression/formation protein HypC